MPLSVDTARELLAGDRAAFEARWPEVLLLLIDDPDAREALGEFREPLSGRDEADEGAYWVAMMLGVLHDEPLVALEPETRRGFVGRMSGVVDNFQLQMEAFERLPERIAAIARGDGPQTSEELVIGAWNLYTCHAFRTGQLPVGNDSTDTWIWNEGTPSDIPVLDGHRVILLGEPAYERSWAAQRTFEPLPASLNARPLEPGELDDWVARITADA